MLELGRGHSLRDDEMFLNI